MYKKVDDTVWPDPDKMSDLSHKVRYNSEFITKMDLMYIASVISAYKSLFDKTNARRNYICNNPAFLKLGD